MRYRSKLGVFIESFISNKDLGISAIDATSSVVQGVVEKYILISFVERRRTEGLEMQA
jgi:hypothetical protein